MTNITRRRGELIFRALRFQRVVATRRWLRFGLLATALCPLPALSQDLVLPRDAEQTYRMVQDPGVYSLPIGPFADGALPTERIEGAVTVESWHLPDTTLTPFQIVLPLREALEAAGFEIRLDCAARRCGGFDFRFNTLVLPAPEMFVRLDDYHFISATSGEGAVSLLASKGDTQGYLQIIRAGQGTPGEVTTSAVAGAATINETVTPGAPSPNQTPAPISGLTAVGDIAQALEQSGFAILSDLDFQSGSTKLGEGAVASLDAIAAYLAAHPSRRVLFVGHTDATGSLAANQRVSLQRAEAAVAYLRTRHGTDAAQISAEGAGYLSPVASNLTAEGRELNRRVEAVLLSTE
jgi:OOP family OmpA-OmpF porin